MLNGNTSMNIQLLIGILDPPLQKEHLSSRVLQPSINPRNAVRVMYKLSVTNMNANTIYGCHLLLFAA
jgi:hypothetical protein